MKKLSNTEAELKKSVAFKKSVYSIRTSSFIRIYILNYVINISYWCIGKMEFFLWKIFLD